jgi:hypothetical protein
VIAWWRLVYLGVNSLDVPEQSLVPVLGRYRQPFQLC